MNDVTDYLKAIGSKGGKAKGEKKRRGGSAYYAELSAKAAKARARKKAAATPEPDSPRAP